MNFENQNYENQMAHHARNLNSVLHGLKIAESGMGDLDILNSDPRIWTIDNMLLDLQRSFPKLQAAIEENAKLWASLSHNFMTMADMLKAVIQSDDPNTPRPHHAGRAPIIWP